MADRLQHFDEERAVERLLRLLAIEGVTGHEKAIGQVVARELKAAGVPARNLRYDTAHERIPMPTQTGNLIVTLPGTQAGPRLLFSCHMDTVPLCAGAVPRLERGRIVAQGETALGGDNRTGVACLVTLAETLLARKLPHPPLTLLFTVREESGLFGARYLEPDDLGGPVMGFNVDGRLPGEITIGAVGAERWEVEITGKASHAGVHPEQGISATLVAALALVEVKKQGWFGRIDRPEGKGTSNVGTFGGKDSTCAGQATNVVTDFVHIRGESRSHDAAFVKVITRAYRDAFREAASEVPDDRGRKARVKFTLQLDYHPFRLNEDAPVVRQAWAAAEQAGLKPSLRVGNGGLDANWLVRHGIPTITIGAGQNNIHTIEEFVDVKLFLDSCRMALALATSSAGATRSERSLS